MVCRLARAGRVLVSGHLGDMPPEPDVTKTSEVRLQELTERLQPRSSQDDFIGHLPAQGGLQDVIINDTTSPARLGNLIKGLIKQHKERENG